MEITGFLPLGRSCLLIIFVWLLRQKKIQQTSCLQLKGCYYRVHLACTHIITKGKMSWHRSKLASYKCHGVSECVDPYVTFNIHVMLLPLVYLQPTSYEIFCDHYIITKLFKNVHLVSQFTLSTQKLCTCLHPDGSYIYNQSHGF